MRTNRGIALILVIIIIAVTAIAVLSIGGFIANGMAISSSRVSREEALYAAQAGVYAALYDYSGGSRWSRALNVSLGNNRYYSIGKNANFLLVTASNPQVYNDTTLRRIPLRNLNDSSTITATRMIVEWHNVDDAAFRLQQVRLGGTSRFAGNADSGASITLNPPFRLLRRQVFGQTTDNQWTFTQSIPRDAIIIVTFFFGDDSSRKVFLLNAGRSGNNEFSITSTGQARGNINWKRTLEATYDTEVGRITSWQESEDHI